MDAHAEARSRTASTATPAAVILADACVLSPTAATARSLRPSFIGGRCSPVPTQCLVFDLSTMYRKTLSSTFRWRRWSSSSHQKWMNRSTCCRDCAPWVPKPLFATMLGPFSRPGRRYRPWRSRLTGIVVGKPTAAEGRALMGAWGRAIFWCKPDQQVAGCLS